MRGCKNLAECQVQSLLTAEGAKFCAEGAEKNHALRSSASAKESSALPKGVFIRPSPSDGAALSRQRKKYKSEPSSGGLTKSMLRIVQ